MKIVADENIPFVEEAFGSLGTVELHAGRSITAEIVREADVLLVRSVTKVNQDLLQNSRVRFVGSATIGTDHIDKDFLEAQDIAFAHAPGSNAASVVEYVMAALVQVAVNQGSSLQDKTVGIVGCGNIGSYLAERLPALGLQVLVNDPPLADAEEKAGRSHRFVELDALLAASDIVTVHVPLTREGPYPTYHLIDEAALQKMKPQAWLLNTSRGATVSNQALKRALQRGHLGSVVLDVWEKEPTPDPELLEMVDLATPHIAGYSYDGKVMGTVMLYRALVDHMDVPHGWDAEVAFSPGEGESLQLSPSDADLPQWDWMHDLIRQMYDIAGDDQRLRRVPDLPEGERGDYFSYLRKTYPRRRTFSRYFTTRHALPEKYRYAVEKGLEVQLR